MLRVGGLPRECILAISQGGGKREMRRKSRASKAAGLQLGCCSVIERGPLATLRSSEGVEAWQPVQMRAAELTIFCSSLRAEEETLGDQIAGA